jgi:hypothetical protein
MPLSGLLEPLIGRCSSLVEHRDIVTTDALPFRQTIEQGYRRRSIFCFLRGK